MDANESKPNRSNRQTFGMLAGLFLSQNILSMIIFDTYATGILPLLECVLVAYFWHRGRIALVSP